MLKSCPIAIAAVFLCCPVWAEEKAENPAPEETPQEQPAPAARQTQGETGTATAPAENDAGSAAGETPIPDEDEKSILDDQTFEGEDDDFIPTEEVPVAEPIPFPTDI